MESKENKNLSLYNLLRSVPDNAKKPINGGRLNGFTDINPMWRIKVLTENFGPVGFGWRYDIVRQWTDAVGEEVRAFCTIHLYVKVNGEWGAPIPGTGGSAFATREKSGLHVSDECYKMALTDALGVAMKALGVAADVYFAQDMDSKYHEFTAAPATLEEAVKELDASKSQEQYTEVWNRYSAWYSNDAKFYQKAIEVSKRFAL